MRWSSWPGMEARVSRGIEILLNEPPPAWTTISVSARDGRQVDGGGSPWAAASRHFGSVSAPASFDPSGRASVPITRMFWPCASRNGNPPSSSAAVVVELGLLDLGGNREGGEADQQPDARGDRDPLEDAAPLRPLPGRRRLRPAASGQAIPEGRPVGARPLEAAASLVDGIARPLGGGLRARPVPRAFRFPGLLVSLRLGPSPASTATGLVDVVLGAIRAFGVAGCHYAVILPHALPDSCFVTAVQSRVHRRRPDDRGRPRRHEDARRRRRRAGRHRPQAGCDRPPG